MKLADLHIDFLGFRSNLCLSDLSDRVNVVFDPSAEEATTIIQFIRWMVFGRQDSAACGHLEPFTDVRGMMNVKFASGLRTLKRSNVPGSPAGQLTIDDQSSSSNPMEISCDEFDQFFVVSVDQPHQVEELLASTASHGFPLWTAQTQVDRVRHLSDQLQQHQFQLNQLGHDSEDLNALRVSLRRKQQEMEGCEREVRAAMQKTELQRNECQDGLRRQQLATERLRNVLDNVEQAIERRRSELVTTQQRQLDAGREADRLRQHRLDEVDGQLDRWRSVLSDAQTRLQHVRARITAFGEHTDAHVERAKVQGFTRQLRFQIRDIDSDLSGSYEGEPARDYDADIQYLRGLLTSGTNSMHADITRLCKIVEQQQQASDLKEYRAEAEYLCRVQQELVDLLESLARKKRLLTGEGELLQTDSGESIGCVERNAEGGVAGNQPESLDDFRLRHLVDRREAAAARFHQSELELVQTQHRLRQLDEESSSGHGHQQVAQRKGELEELEVRLRLAEQREGIKQSIAAIQDELGCTHEFVGQSDVVSQASEILQQLTDHEYREIRVRSDRHCVVYKTADATPCSYSQLSRAVQDQVYLAIVLAIGAEYRRRGMIAPLLLNDVFVNLNDHETRSLCRLIEAYAAEGSQVMVFTRHPHVREAFDVRTNRVYSHVRLESPTAGTVASPPPSPISTPLPPAPTADLPPAPHDPSYQWVAEWQRRNPISPDVDVQPESQPGPTEVDRPDDDRPDEEVDLSDTELTGTKALHLHSPIGDTAVLSDDFRRCLKAVSVLTVEDFLELDPLDAAERLADYEITAEMIQRRQRELLMCLYLDIPVRDAQLLVACGVPDPARLGRADESVLLKRIESVLGSPQVVERFGEPSEYPHQRIHDWITAARRCGYSRRVHQPFASNRPLQAVTHDGQNNGSRSNQQRRATVKMKTGLKLRFYLEVNDPVVDAPSVGPKTAEKLNAIDIHTVGNLLNADSDEVASQLSDRRISADTVSSWQMQAQLVCRIPNLRGHDAQILVACGVEDPVTLAGLDAGTFLKKVKRFIQSKEGQRIIRNAKKPDLAEVTAWIEWAESARQLRAA